MQIQYTVLLLTRNSRVLTAPLARHHQRPQSLYFVYATMMTIGFGDFFPNNADALNRHQNPPSVPSSGAQRPPPPLRAPARRPRTHARARARARARWTVAVEDLRLRTRALAGVSVWLRSVGCILLSVSLVSLLVGSVQDLQGIRTMQLKAHTRAKLETTRASARVAMKKVGADAKQKVSDGTI